MSDNDQPSPFGFSPFGNGGQPFPGMPGMPGFPMGQFGGPGMPDLNAMMNQFQALMAPHEGAINWPAIVDLARKQIAAEPDPSVSERDRAAIADALRLADAWLDPHTSFATGVTQVHAWSRAEWLVATEKVWHQLIEPIAASSRAMMTASLTDEMKQMMGPMVDMIAGGATMMMSQQVAAGLATVAGDVMTASDIGLPLTETGIAALVPINVEAFGADLDADADDLRLYLALREAAHVRLYAGVPWLRDHLVQAIADYCSGIAIDPEAMARKVEGINLNDPAALQEAMSSNLFQPDTTPAQAAALAQLEVTLALIEGWVDHVVTAATRDKMPSADKLREVMQRRRAAGGPAEQALAAMVGLELRPRRMRDASALWASLTERQGIEARDAVWMHPHLLPTSTDLDAPERFREDAITLDEIADSDLDAALRDLLDGE